MFGADIQSHFGEIQIGADSRGSRDFGSLLDIFDDFFGQGFGRQFIKFQIRSNIEKRFVDGINMNIVFGDIFQINAIDIGGEFDIFFHPGVP